MSEHADGVTPPSHAAGVCNRAREEGAHTVVTVYGEVDLDAAPGWENQLHRALNDSAGGLVLDLRALRFCDCAGLNVLLRVRRAALAVGKTVTITAASPAVTRLLHLTGIQALFAPAPAVAVPAPAAPAVTSTLSRPPLPLTPMAPPLPSPGKPSLAASSPLPPSARPAGARLHTVAGMMRESGGRGHPTAI